MFGFDSAGSEQTSVGSTVRGIDKVCGLPE